MTLGHKHYPNGKAASYTILCKYIPKCTKKNNESTTMRKMPVTGVSFYQRATPFNGPPVAGKNYSTEDIITFWKCRHRGHRSPLCPKFDDKGFQGMQFMFTQGMHPLFAGKFTHH